MQIWVETKNFKGIQADCRALPRVDSGALMCRHYLKPFCYWYRSQTEALEVPAHRLGYRLSAGLHNQIELQKFLKFVQNHNISSHLVHHLLNISMLRKYCIDIVMPILQVVFIGMLYFKLFVI